MRVEDLKRWHWCVLGVLAGCAYAWIKMWAGPEAISDAKTVAPAVFEQQLFAGNDRATNRRVYKIEDIRLHAPVPVMVQGTRERVTAEYISYDAWLIERQPQQQRPRGAATRGAAAKPPEPPPPPKAEKFRFALVMQEQIPQYKSVLGVDVSKMEVRDYLAKLKELVDKDPKRFAHVPPLDYKFNWLETPRGAYAVYPAAGFVIVGLIWPTIIGVLTGAGWGRPPKVKDDYDLNRFGKGKPRTRREKAAAAATAAEMAQLAAVEAELEAKLREGVGPRVEQPEEPAAAEAPVKVLSAGPLETPKEIAERPKQDKGFGADQGDYYPTEVHGKKKS